MANVVMPEQIIKDTYGEIPDELIDVEKLLEEAGLSCTCKAPHWEQPKRCSEKDLVDSLIHDLGKEDLEDRFVKLQLRHQSGTLGLRFAVRLILLFVNAYER